MGVDTSDILVARVGVRGDNDLVWVGRAANYAAKLCAMNKGYQTYITASVYNAILDSVTPSKKDKKEMWDVVPWDARKDVTVYGSTWWVRVD